VHLCPQTGRPTPDKAANGDKKIYYNDKARQAALMFRLWHKDPAYRVKYNGWRTALRAKRRKLGLCIDCGLPSDKQRCDVCFERTN